MFQLGQNWRLKFSVPQFVSHHQVYPAFTPCPGFIPFIFQSDYPTLNFLPDSNSTQLLVFCIHAVPILQSIITLHTSSPSLVAHFPLPIVFYPIFPVSLYIWCSSCPQCQGINMSLQEPYSFPQPCLTPPAHPSQREWHPHFNHTSFSCSPLNS